MPILYKINLIMAIIYLICVKANTFLCENQTHSLYRNNKIFCKQMSS